MLEWAAKELPDSNDPEKEHRKCAIGIYAKKIFDHLEEESAANKAYRRMARLVTILTILSAVTALVNIIRIFL